MNPTQLAAALALVIAEQRVEIERLRGALAQADAPQPAAPESPVPA